jgi:hypothetical protein
MQFVPVVGAARFHVDHVVGADRAPLGAFAAETGGGSGHELRLVTQKLAPRPVERMVGGRRHIAVGGAGSDGIEGGAR